MSKCAHVRPSNVPFPTLILTDPLNAEPAGKDMELGTVDEAISESKFCSEATRPASSVDAIKTANSAVPFGYTGFCVSHGSRENAMLDCTMVCNEEGDKDVDAVGGDDGEVLGCDDGAAVGSDDGKVLGDADASLVYTRSSSNVKYKRHILEPVNRNVSGDSATEVIVLLLFLFWK